MPTIILHGAYAPQSVGKPIADLRVRQALSLAINRDEMLKTFYGGKASFPMTPYLFDTSADVDIPYWRDYAAKLYRYDPEEAKQLLKDAGYPQGFSLQLWSYTASGSTDLPKMDEVIQGYWRQIGVVAQIVPTDAGTYNAVRNELKSPVMIGNADAQCPGESPMVAQGLRKAFHTQGNLSILNKAFPEMDKLIDDAMSETDASKRKEMLATAIKTCADTYTELPIAYGPYMVALGPKVSINFPKPSDSFVGYYLEIAQHAK
jgi:ABC-type transport system substrate-binding protein